MSTRTAGTPSGDAGEIVEPVAPLPEQLVERTAVAAPKRLVEKTIRFLRSYRCWNRGVEAGFPAAAADDLIARRIAVDVALTGREPLAGRMIRKG